jgi:hypothetical protein
MGKHQKPAHTLHANLYFYWLCHRLTNYPLDGKEMDLALNSLYLYHKLQLGDNPASVRYIYGRPKLVKASKHGIDSDSDDDDEHSDSANTTTALFDLQICIFPDFSMSMEVFYEQVTSTSFSFELYDNPVSTILSKSFLDGYLNLTCEKSVIGTKKADSSSKASNEKKGKEKEVAEKAAKGKKEVSTKTAVGPSNAVDRYMIESIMSGLAQHREIYAHGSLRYRLDQLLSDTAELAIKFANMRNPNPTAGDAAGQRCLAVEDDLVLDLRYENPTKPQPWKLPEDLSLRKALADTAATVSKSKTTIKKSVFELCVDCDTQMLMTAKLYKHMTTAPSASIVTAQDEALRKKVEHVLSTILASVDMPAAKKLALAKSLALTPYGRMILVMDYDNDSFLTKVNNIINTVNSRVRTFILDKATIYPAIVYPTDSSYRRCPISKGTLCHTASANPK